MTRISTFLVSVFLLAVFAVQPVAAALDVPDIARGARAYQGVIKRQHPGEPNEKISKEALEKATKFAQTGEWAKALPEYEKAVAYAPSSGDETSRIWLRISRAHVSIKKVNRQRAQFAAFMAQVTAESDKSRGYAILVLGNQLERVRDYDRAIDVLAEGLKLVKDDRWQKYYDKLVRTHGFRVSDVRTETEQKAPEALLVFSHKLKERGVNYGDYVRIEPKGDTAIKVRNREIVISGLEHGQSYKVEVLKGLPGMDGKAIPATQDFTVEIGNREPSLGFGGGKYVLPSKSTQALPLISVNVSQAKVKVVRISDRILVKQIKDGSIARILSGYDLSRLTSEEGEVVWEGTLEIQNKLNEQVSTGVPMKGVLGKGGGIYVVTAVDAAKEQESWYDQATQWVIVSDIGLTTMDGPDGLHVFARSLATGKPMAGVNMHLVARNNEFLGGGQTDRNGHVVIGAGFLRGKGGKRPAALTAYGGGEFNFIDLTKPGYDFSDRGVAGRAAPGPVDVFLYSERGIYRPGETAKVSLLVRDDKAKAVEGVPITLKVLRPDGTEDRRLTVKDFKAGGAALDIDFEKSDRTGFWTVEAYVDPKGAAVGRVRFQVEDFVPERIEMVMKPEQEAIVPGKANWVDMSARFLYGAPAGDLGTEAEIILRRDHNPFPELKGYTFGLVDEEWRSKRIELETGKTDSDGKLKVKLDIGQVPETSVPLKATVRMAVLEMGGRPTTRSLTLPVRHQELAIGIKKLAEGTVPKGEPAAFEIIAVGQDGKPKDAKGLKYTLYRENWSYQWYYRDQRWRYRAVREDEKIGEGEVAVTAAAPGKISKQLDWGSYRLEVHDPETQTASSSRFWVGWYGGFSTGDTPDKLTVKLDKDSYKAGETAKVHIRAPFAGEVLVTVAGDKIHEVMNVTVPRDGTELKLKVDSDWGSGVYVTATAFRPGKTKAEGPGAQNGPGRAVGLAWMGIDPAPRTLEVKVTVPESIRPRQKIEVPIEVAGASGEAYVTLAAVDEGILFLTDYETPSPDGYYYGKRRLAYDYRDLYGRLIEAASGRIGKLRQGGDAAAKRHTGGLDASAIKTVSLFSGVVKLSGGKAKITLNIPDFNGRLRFMAVAWTKDKTGHGEAKMEVRDPVVSQVSFGRFLAPGDESRLSLRLDNVDGPDGAYQVSFATEGAVEVKGESLLTVDMKPGKKHNANFMLSGRSVGTGKIIMTMSGPSDFKITRSWDISVRPAQAVQSRQIAKRVEPGGSVKLDSDLLSGFLPGTTRALVSFSRAPALNLPGLLEPLDRYPYGCAEQTTSRALPLLYVNDVAQAIGLGKDDGAIRQRVQKSIRRVISMQSSDGGFGLWRTSDARDAWLSAYVMDFLLQADGKDYFVPRFAIDRGLVFLEDRIRGSDFEPGDIPAVAYAFYILAREKKVSIGALRYFHDVFIDRVDTPLALAQLGAALTIAGDAKRGASAFAKASAKVDREGNYSDYGTVMRDLAATVVLASVTKQTPKDLPEMVERLVALKGKQRYTSTQEKAWLLLAAHALIGEGGAMSIAIDGKAMTDVKKPYYMAPKEEALKAGITVKNTGDSRIWHSLTVSGVPSAELPAESNGFVINRAFYTLEGKQVDLAKVPQNETLVVVINGEATSGLPHQALIVDLLPAGFEIENTRLTHSRDNKDLGFLPELTRLEHMELRDDRFVAQVDLTAKENVFTVAYLVRAVTPGTYAMPAPFVEDMYQPRYFARQAMGRMSVTAPIN